MIELLEAIGSSTGYNPKPLETDKVETCIVYRYHQTGRFNYHLELRVIGFSLMEVDSIVEDILEGINDFGDTAKVRNFASIELNGGGVMKDNNTNTIQKVLYFDVVKK